MILSTIVTPILLIWRLMDFAEPQGILDFIRQITLVLITGIGAMGIGTVIAYKLSKILAEEHD